MTVSSRQPVIVFGSGLTVLGAIRLLHRAGFAPFVIGETTGLARLSRWFQPAPPSRSRVDPLENLAEYLTGLPFERAPLLPCSDAWTLRVAWSGASAAGRFPASISAPEVLDRLIDKWRLAELMRELDLPHPRTAVLDTTTGAHDLAAAALDAAFIKPRDSARFTERFDVKGFKVRTRSELLERIAEIAPTGLTVQLQEYVPGPPTNHFYVEGFIDRDGQMPGLFLRRRLRMYPLDFGNSTMFESIPVSAYPDAIDTVKRLLGHVGYRGVFSVEFKQDARDGVCRLIEVNARPWWYVEFAGQCGVNVCEMAVRDALGERVAAVTAYRTGLRCMYPYLDFAAYVAMRREGRLTLAQWIASWATSTQPVFRWSDPVPALAATLPIVRYRTGVFVKSLFGHTALPKPSVEPPVRSDAPRSDRRQDERRDEDRRQDERRQGDRRGTN